MNHSFVELVQPDCRIIKYLFDVFAFKSEIWELCCDSIYTLSKLGKQGLINCVYHVREASQDLLQLFLSGTRAKVDEAIADNRQIPSQVGYTFFQIFSCFILESNNTFSDLNNCNHIKA